MLSPIKLDTLEIDKGKPFVNVELSDKKDGETIKIFLTRADMEVLTKYFDYAETVLAYED